MLGRCLFLFLFFISFTCMFSQNQDKVDFTHANVSISINPITKEIIGNVVYEFEVQDKVDSVFLDAKKMVFKSIRLNGKKVKSRNDEKILSIYKNFKKGRFYSIALSYSVKPTQTVYFLGFEDSIAGNEQVWTQGQGKYTSYWLPSLDDMTEKVEFDLSITFDKTYDVIANGKLQKVKEVNDRKTWSFDMKQPMSSYLVAFAIGVYDQQELSSKNGIPIINFYYVQDSLKVEPTYRYTKEIFDLLEVEIGVPYPWQNYKQLPVRDFLYAGMENTGTTIFSDGFVIDSIAFTDKNYVNVNAHELAHQWFGNLVTEVNGNHHWLHEGFATYYALLAEKEIFGDEYFYWKLFDSSEKLNEFSKEKNGEALVNPKASSLTFYEKGAWALHMLRDEIGDVAFKKGIKNYLQKYQYRNVTTQDFIWEMEQASSKELTFFSEMWLNAKDFPFAHAKENLISHSKPLDDFIKLKWELTTSLEEKQKVIQRYWNATSSDELKARLIANYHKSLPIDFLENTFNSKSVKVRQALATSFDKIPIELKSSYESLLNDKSYVTIENALYRLWVSFPKNRVDYLDQTNDIEGLPNKNVRLLWLLLAGLTKDYGDDELKENYISELFTYTSPKFSMEIRQSAFGLIGEVFEYSDQNIKDLINASVHHSWRFRNFARTLLEELLKDDEQKIRVKELSKGLKEDELSYIRTKIGTL